jgi:hypothetical protein
VQAESRESFEKGELVRSGKEWEREMKETGSWERPQNERPSAYRPRLWRTLW